MKKLLNALLFLTLALNSFSQFETGGCTDPTASNFDPNALFEDGSCCYSDLFITVSSDGNGDALVSDAFYSLWNYVSFPGTNTLCLDNGCLQFDILNYGPTPLVITFTSSEGDVTTHTVAPFENSFFNISLGSTETGCTDPASCNYNPEATCPGECIYDCYGCTDPNAFNYDANATIEAGICCYDASNYYTILASGPIGVSASNYYVGEYTFAVYPANNGFCMSSSCFDMSIVGTTSAENVSYQIFGPEGNVVAEGVVNQMESDYVNVSVGVEAACGDPSACNYDPNATCLDFTICDYSCLGCTDPSAVNFNPDATIDNGSCCNSDSWATIVADDDVFAYITGYSVGVYQQIYLTANQSQNICLPPGCYNIELYNSDFSNIESNVLITAGDGTVLLDTEITGQFFYNQFAYNATVGCAEPTACNYDPTVTCNDYYACDYSCYGCTNPEADNFDPNATIDDNSCCLNTYTLITSSDVYWTSSVSSGYAGGYGYTEAGQTEICINEGCYYITLYGFDFVPFEYSIIDEEGNVVAEGSSSEYYDAYINLSIDAVEGCMDQAACNYDPNANCWLQSLCTYDCYGCTDPSAANFDETALINDGSCCFGDFYTIETNSDVWWYAYTLTGNGSYASGLYPFNTGFCMDDACFGVSLYSYGGLPISYTIYAPDGSVFAQGEENQLGFVELVFGNTQTVGCSDSNACNFDPNADCGYYWLCDYSCYGCTDSNAPNFNPEATINDGSCCTNSWFTVEFNGPAFWLVYNNATGEYFAGNYPEQDGFCNAGECVLFQAYSYSGEILTYTITNEMNQIVDAGSAGDFGYVSIPLSFSGNEVAGCNDPLACNFNPAATCNAGNCEYYCGGCTDPNAINFNPSAGFDDGTCFYDIEPPMFVIQTEDDLTQEQYFVRADVMSLGNGAPYILANDYNSEMMMVDENGQYWIGPFPCGQDVVLSVNSAVYGMTEYMVSDPLSGGCGIILNTEENKEATNLYSVFPNPSNGLINFSGPASEKTTIRVMDMTGRVVFEKYYDQIIGNTEFDLQNLTNGYYQVQIIQLNRSENLPLIIKK